MAHADQPTGFDDPWWRYPSLRNALLAGAVTGIAFSLAHLGGIGRKTEIVLYIAAIPVGGWYWMHGALTELIAEREISIDLLMVAATAGSAALGLWDEAAFLVFLYGAAEGLEEYTYSRTRHAIRTLLDLAPKEAHLLSDGREIVVAAETLRPGDRFLVRPGESIPTDGIVKAGVSGVDESSVTGESIASGRRPKQLLRNCIRWESTSSCSPETTCAMRVPWAVHSGSTPSVPSSNRIRKYEPSASYSSGRVRYSW